MNKIKANLWKPLTPVSVTQMFWKLFDLLIKIKSIESLWSLVKHVAALIRFVKVNRSQNSSSLWSSVPDNFTSLLKSLKMIKSL